MFKRDSPTPLETLRKLMDEEPARPGAIAPGVDRDLETVCLRCLEKSPLRRYGSAQALADDLDSWLDERAIQARPARLTERAWKCARRHPSLAGMGAVTLLAVGAASGVFFHLPTRNAKTPPALVTSPASQGAGSFREIISQAEPGAIVRFAPSLIGQTVHLTNGEMVLAKDLTIAGPGADKLTISGNHVSRLFHLESNSVVTIFGLTIADGSALGRAVADRGAGFRVEAGSTLSLKGVVLEGHHSLVGGAIHNHGNVSIEESTLRDNVSEEGGAGIFNEGFLRLNRVTFSGNSSTRSGAAALENLNGTVLAHNTTFFGNHASYGVIWNFSQSATLTLESCTLSGNTIGLGNARDENEGAVTLRNTIVAGNQTDIMKEGRIRSGGHNLIGSVANSPFVALATDFVGTDPQLIDPLLGPLANNGGATLTLLPQLGSPALGAGEYTGLNGHPLNFDQRGVARPGNGPCDIGAVQTKSSR
jgi:hypothetical protein